MLSNKRIKTASKCNKLSARQTPDAIANNDDLLTEILVRLPIKSLLRFKSVSNHWLSLISSPHFSRCLYPDPYSVSGLFLHISSFLINPEHDFVSLGNKPVGAPFRSLTFVNHPSGLRILQSCHGLLCCSSFRDRHFKHAYYIYNPTTKQFVTLPQPGGGNSSIAHVFGMNLAFDPAKSPHYKVVCVRSSVSLEVNELDTYSCNQIEIYSSKTRSWRLSGDPFTAPSGTQYKGGVFCDGAIHWISSWGTSLYFKVDEEQLQEMPMPLIPEGWDEGRRFRYFGESRNHLHLIEIYGPHTKQVNVYEMERDYSRWFVKYRVDLEVVTTAFPEMIRSYLSPSDLNYYAFTILSIAQEEHDGESYMVLHIPGKAIYYNLKDKTIKKICDFAPDDADIEGIRIEGSIKFGGYNASQYIETLACV